MYSNGDSEFFQSICNNSSFISNGGSCSQSQGNYSSSANGNFLSIKVGNVLIFAGQGTNNYCKIHNINGTIYSFCV